MRVLMLGWEFPPFISGGLGTACYGLTRAMSQCGTEVVFVLPRPIPEEYSSHVKMAGAGTIPGTTSGSDPAVTGRQLSGIDVFGSEEFSNVSFRAIPSMIHPYQTAETYEETLEKLRHGAAGEALRKLGKQLGQELSLESLGQMGGNYGNDLYLEVQRYARIASLVSQEEEFDVVHAHDWMTYPAGIAVAGLSGKPLVVHIHSTEFDRSGEGVNQMVYDIERQGLHYADKVIAVSHLTRNVVLSRYSVPETKVKVVYNAIERQGGFVKSTARSIEKNEKIVLFLGRITMQKGPEYFIAAAKKVLEVMGDVKFVMAGSGDMAKRMIELAAEMGIGHKVLFTGFLRGDDVDRIFRMADLFVMPSVSEPFGLVPLEALRNDVPVIISKQSGVAEVLNHALKVDFWDVNEMANKIVAVLRHPPLQETLREHGNFEVRKLSWNDAAKDCIDVYESVSAVAV